jgi:alkylhydroperoxidase/carboxymuconolactone decarboxylase family protein YurZ
MHTEYVSSQKHLLYLRGPEEECVTDDELREVTRKTAEMLFGPPKKGEGAYQLWRQFDPELARQMSMFYTGRLYSREVISQKQRELCAVAALTVLQRLEELRLHIGAALNVGATKEEIAEVIFQMMTYGGVPTTVEGLKICKAVLEERGLWQED